MVIFMMILGLLIAFYTPKSDGPDLKVNSKIEDRYSALKNGYYLNFLVVEKNEDLRKLEEITDGKLLYYIRERNKEGFHCKDWRMLKRVQYSSYFMGRNFDGGWWGIDVLDCGDYYYILEMSDSGRGPIYGSFNKY